MDDVTNVERLRYDYRRLRSAIGPIPSPAEVYDQIVLECINFHSSRRSLLSLTNNLQNLYSGALSRTEFFQTHQHLKHSMEKLHLRLLLVRTHLRTLWNYPPLFFATNVLQPFEWEQQMDMVHVANDGAELSLFPEEVEPLISDSLDAIGENLAKLRDLRDEIDAGDLKEDLHFRHQVLKSLREISQHLTQDDQARVPQKTTEPEGAEDVVYVGTGPLQMDIRFREVDVIQRNEPFMEPIDEEPEEESSGEDSDELEMIDDTLDDEDEEQAVEEPEPTPHEARRSTTDEATRLRLQLQQTQASVRSFRAACEELENKERCPARRYQEGHISDRLQAMMPCVFCGRRGDHFSDSCTIVTKAKERKLRLQSFKRCTMCLKKACPRGKLCKKADTPCYHCKKTGHNSAICSLPEKSEQIEHDLQIARESYADSVNLARSLEERIRQQRTQFPPSPY
ncbi:hypothetical protein V3C99_018627 [Haemonchus contortus]